MAKEEIRESVATYSQPELESHEHPIGDEVFYPESDGEPMRETVKGVKSALDSCKQSRARIKDFGYSSHQFSNNSPGTR